MPDQLIQFRTWRIRSDSELNQQIFRRISSGLPEECGCEGCRQFIRMRETFYTPELRELLAALGIDYRKETDVTNMGDESSPHWTGWYNLSGTIESGEQDVHYLDGDFQLMVATGASALAPEIEGPFPDATWITLEWTFPVKDLRFS